MGVEVGPAGVLVLTGDHTVRNAHLTHKLLLEMLASGDVTVDCDGIEEADVTLLQLLIAARRSAHRAGRSLTLVGATAGVLGAMLAATGYAPRDGDSWSDRFWAGETER